MPVPEHPAAVDRHLLRDTAYAKLCDAIVDGTLTPGEALHDDALCGWLGLSRTPVRDALSRLRDERLVEMEPQRYTRVAPLRAEDVHDLVQLLAALHALATELAVPALGASELAALRRHNDSFFRALRAGDGEGAYAADDAFHGVFVASSGNTELAPVLEHLVPRLHRFEHLCDSGLPGRRSVAQHEAMIGRAELGDARGAAIAARANWMTLGAVFERSLTGTA